MTDKAQIKEIFTSIQGEGPFIGYKQLFIRFCGCNLTCDFCDTEYGEENSKNYTVEELVNIAKQHLDCHSVSLTGGEPLLHAGFLKEFLPQCPLPVYLETNSTLAGELSEIIDYVDYVAADIKLPSATGGIGYWKDHSHFFETATHKEMFAKIVFDENITEEEITEACKLGAHFNVELILQPKCNPNKNMPSTEFIESVLDKFLEKYRKVRLIPQVHKFLDVK